MNCILLNCLKMTFIRLACTGEGNKGVETMTRSEINSPGSSYSDVTQGEGFEMRGVAVCAD